jgi:hypothetical protein
VTGEDQVLEGERGRSAPVALENRLFTDEGLVGGFCAACSRRHFPLAEWCPWCGADDQAAVTLSTEGTVWSWTAVTSPPPGSVGDVPFGFGVVELPADGLRVVTRLLEADPSQLHEGRPVSFRVVDLDGETRTWAFG